MGTIRLGNWHEAAAKLNEKIANTPWAYVPIYGSEVVNQIVSSKEYYENRAKGIGSSNTTSSSSSNSSGSDIDYNQLLQNQTQSQKDLMGTAHSYRAAETEQNRGWDYKITELSKGWDQKIADTEGVWDLKVADSQGAASRDVAKLQADASRDVANIQGRWTSDIEKGRQDFTLVRDEKQFGYQTALKNQDYEGQRSLIQERTTQDLRARDDARRAIKEYRQRGLM